MYSQTSPVQRRRPRCVFHYKVDETIRAEDRDAYFALIRDPRTTIDVAHAWLLERGYTLSRSAVARHRRRLLSGEAEHRANLDRAVAFARLAGSPDAPDFAAGANVQLQHLVFERLMAIGEIIQSQGLAWDNDDDEDDNGRADRLGKAMTQIPTSELLMLSKLVAQCVDLTRRIGPDLGKRKSDPAPAPAPTPEDAAQRDAKLRGEIQEILFGRNPNSRAS